MNKKTIMKSLRVYMPFVLVTVAFLICQSMIGAKTMPRTFKSYMVPICVYITMAVSLNLTVGFSGELSLGHAGFMSLGCFSGIVATTVAKNVWALPVWAQILFGLIVGGVIAGIAGVLIGIPVLRLRGDYLAIVTLAFGEIIRNVLNCIYISLDNGTVHFAFNNIDIPGKMIFRGPTGATGANRIATFTVGFLLVIFTLIVVTNLVRSRTGRAIMAIRDNRIAAESVGLNITKYKMIAFVTSAALAGMGGALFGMNYSTVTPGQFSFNASILILVYVVLGGLGNITGSIIAATVLYILPEELRAFSEFRMLAYAIVLIVVMVLTNSKSVKNMLAAARANMRRKAGKEA